MIRSVVCSQDSQDMECLTTHIAILGIKYFAHDTW